MYYNKLDGIKKYLEQLIEEYHQLNEQLDAAVRAANQQYKENAASDMYTAEYLENRLKDSVDKAHADFAAQAAALNANAKKHIAALKRKILPALSDTAKAADYAVKVNNALQFIQLEGVEISDETASEILREFIGDIETMKRFRSVIEHQRGEKLTDAYGRTTFPLTFGWLTKCEQLTAAFSELEETAAHLFTRKKAETETEFLRNGLKLSVPMDSYMQHMDEKNTSEQAETVEAMLTELFPTSD